MVKYKKTCLCVYFTLIIMVTVILLLIGVAIWSYLGVVASTISNDSKWK